MSPPILDHSRGPAMGLAVFVLSCGGRPADTNADSRSGLPEPNAETPGAGTSSLSPDPVGTAPVIVDAPLPDDFLLAETDERLADLCEADDASVSAQLEPYRVHHDSPVRRTLYSWTRAAQIEELRQDPTLLTRSVNTQGERGRAGDLLLEHAATDPVAQVLSEERFTKTRHAWANSWATLQGWTGEDYGNRLLAITLKPEAWIAEMHTSAGGTLTWRFFDMFGASVNRDSFLAAPERLGAIYFVDDSDPGNCSGEFTRRGSVLREYVLCNEGMIERYAAFTDAIHTQIVGELTALRAMRDRLVGTHCESASLNQICWRGQVAARWGAVPEQTKNQLLGAYEASLAFPNDLYVPNPTNLQRLVSRLEAVPFDEPPLEYVYPNL